MGEQLASTIIYSFVAVAAVLAIADILYRRRDKPMRKGRDGAARWDV
jgi:hypothetical protein